MKSGSYELSDVRADRVEIECSTCNRRGSYGTARLIERYGGDIALPDLRRQLVDCQARATAGACQARFTADTVASWQPQ